MFHLDVPCIVVHKQKKMLSKYLNKLHKRTPWAQIQTITAQCKFHHPHINHTVRCTTKTLDLPRTQRLISCTPKHTHIRTTAMAATTTRGKTAFVLFYAGNDANVIKLPLITQRVHYSLFIIQLSETVYCLHCRELADLRFVRMCMCVWVVCCVFWRNICANAMIWHQINDYNVSHFIFPVESIFGWLPDRSK